MQMEKNILLAICDSTIVGSNDRVARKMPILCAVDLLLRSCSCRRSRERILFAPRKAQASDCPTNSESKHTIGSQIALKKRTNQKIAVNVELLAGAVERVADFVAENDADGAVDCRSAKCVVVEGVEIGGRPADSYRG